MDKMEVTKVNEWPNWKKDAYNKMFAVSAHAEKIVVKQ